MKVGDKVRILKSFTDEDCPEIGWGGELMDEEIGRDGEIVRLKYGGFVVNTGYKITEWSWPEECLEVVKNSIDETHSEVMGEIRESEEERLKKLLEKNEDGSYKRTFSTGSVRDNDDNKPLPSELDPYVRLRFGYHMKKGALKYEKGNWRKGQPTETALESAHRHLALYEVGDRTEDHLSAFLFAIQLIMKNEQKEGINYDYFWNLDK